MNDQLTLESMSQAVWYNRWTLKKFNGFLNGKILEIGCGIGNFTKELIKYGEVYAIDIDQNHLKHTKKIVDKKVKLGLGDIEKGKYFFDSLRFDSIVCLNVLEHIKDDKKALTNIFNLLRREGYLVLLVPAHDFLYGEIDQSIGHFRRYNKEEVINKLRNLGFKVISCRVLNMLGAVGWLLSGRILSNKVISKNKIKVFNLFAPLFLTIEDLIQPPFGTSFLIVAQKT